MVKRIGKVIAKRETIRSFDSLVDWVRDSNLGLEDIPGACREMAKKLDALKHPRYGTDWKSWLAKQDYQGLLRNMRTVQD